MEEEVHLPLETIVGRRIIKSNIQISLSKQYSVNSFIHLKRLTSTINLPFQLKETHHFIQPEIRQRIETLQQSTISRTSQR